VKWEGAHMMSAVVHKQSVIEVYSPHPGSTLCADDGALRHGESDFHRGWSSNGIAVSPWVLRGAFHAGVTQTNVFISRPGLLW
jgi:hypothetical protein